MNTLTKHSIAALLVIGTTSSFAANNELAEDLGAAVGSAVGGVYAGNAGAAAGGLAGKYTVRGIDKAISNAENAHFDRRDQQFANQNGVTIEYPGGKTFKPQ